MTMLFKGDGVQATKRSSVPGPVSRNCLFGTVDMGSRLTEPNVCTTLPARITDGLTLSNDPADISDISGLTRLFSNGNFHRYIVGTWRSLVSALAWGARGRRFKSSRPDHDRKNPREVQSPFGNGGAFFSQLRQPGVECRRFRSYKVSME